MDYKKKYEEAMLRMNKWVEGSEIVDPKEVAEYIFPELNESEDERIRNRIINYLKVELEEYPEREKRVNEMLSWLEKQGEQKPTEDNCKISDCDTKVDMTEYNKGFECGKQRVLKYPEDFNLREKSDSTWSEKDESKFKFLYHLLEQNLEIHGSYSFSDVKELGYVTKQEALDMLKSLKGRLNPKPKQVLNEDTQQWVDAIIKDYEELYNTNKDHRTTIQAKTSILKSLKDRVQHQQKQEWSEEDEEMFDAIIADIQFTQKAHTHEVNQVVYEREIDWLKSLKERMKGE